MNEKLREILARYTKAYDEREAGILSFLDEEGELKEGQSREAYDEHSREAWNDSHGDLGSLISELTVLVGLDLKVGDRVLVEADAKTSQGEEVHFDGDVFGHVIGEIDRDGDISVKADSGLSQWVAPRFVKRIQD